MNQTRAMQYCKELSARLPLPVSLLEFETFSNFSSPHKAWIGMSDPLNSGKKENWRDVQNKKPVYIKPTVKTFNGILFKYRKFRYLTLMPFLESFDSTRAFFPFPF